MECAAEDVVAAALAKNFDARALLDLLQQRRARLAKGIDRIDIEAFERRATEVLTKASEKLNNGSFNFSPYLEKLVSKGRNRHPRLIAKPTIRDKLVLWAIKEILHEVLPQCAPKTLPNQVVRGLVKELKNRPGCSITRIDIASFYDQIDRNKLLDLLRSLLGTTTFIDLIDRSISSPIVPHSFRQKDLSKYSTISGVPQGLPISNFLAHTYLLELDRQMGEVDGAYFRYVDDIILLSKEEFAGELNTIATEKLDQLGLKANQDKSHTFKFHQEFEFLGYEIASGLVKPKKASLDKYLRSIAGLFSCLRRKTLPRRGDFSAWSDGDFAELFISELNELITGAVSGGKQYGWIFYFNESNDLEPFARADSVIRRFARRTDLLTNEQRSRIKRCARAIFETRHSKAGGYIKNYDAIITPADKLFFLRSYGYLRKNEVIGLEATHELYEKTREARLNRLDQDIGLIS